MPKYVCEQGHRFIHPAERKQMILPNVEANQFMSVVTGLEPTLKAYVCPFCQSLTFDEAADADVEKVYVYELTTGEQTELDKLLAEGYVIVNRYSKQYHLEKPKEAKAP